MRQLRFTNVFAALGGELYGPTLSHGTRGAALSGACASSGSNDGTGAAGTTGAGTGKGGTTGAAGTGQTTAGTTGTSGTTGTAGTLGGAGTAGGGTTGTAGSGAGTNGGGGTTATAGTGGTTSTGGTTGGGGAAGSRGGTGGAAAGGASGDGWVSILPTDDALTGWFPYVKGYTPGTDPLKTFRRDPQTGYLMVTYADYPNGSFDNHLGLIYYDKKLTNYKVRVEYSFQEPQAKNPVSWGKNNTGLFVYCTDPHLITGNPDFPDRDRDPDPRQSQRGRVRQLPDLPEQHRGHVPGEDRQPDHHRRRWLLQVHPEREPTSSRPPPGRRSRRTCRRPGPG